MVRFSPRARLCEELLVVEGITRAGKFLMAVVASAFEGVEPVQYSTSLESFLVLRRLGKVDADTAAALLHLEFDIRAFDMAMGRYLNTRPDDMSSVLRAPGHEAVLARAAEPNREALLARFLAEKRLPLHLCHEGLPHARELFGFFPKAKVVSMLRDPASLMVSWHKRGWGRPGLAKDPRSMALFYDTPAGPLNWWAMGWKDDYASLSEMERCVLGITGLYEMSRREVEAGGPELEKKLLFVSFEKLIAAPQPELARLAAYLGRKAGPGLKDVLARERLPRAVPADQRAQDLAVIRAHASPRLAEAAEKACADYDAFFLPRAR
jgi:hypothetical protein